MFKKNSSIDVIDKILDACYKHNPDALFIMSLMHQYEERGSLSKKQLQGLFLKAQKVTDMPANWLATLEAVIAKMPNRFKSEAASHTTPLYQKDEALGNTITAILNKYPQHKQVLYLQAKYNNNEPLTATEIAELEKFKKLLL
jgi:hypothetical protein